MEDFWKEMIKTRIQSRMSYIKKQKNKFLVIERTKQAIREIDIFLDKDNLENFVRSDRKAKEFEERVRGKTLKEMFVTCEEVLTEYLNEKK